MRLCIWRPRAARGGSCRGFSAVLDGAKYFDRWRNEGRRRAINNEIVTAAREREGREASPTAAVIDGIRGFDAGKKVSGRKRTSSPMGSA